MTDLELMLSNRLHSARLPDAPASMYEFVSELPVTQARPRPAWRLSLVLIAATIGLLLAIALGALFIATQQPKTSPTPTPTAASVVTVPQTAPASPSPVETGLRADIAETSYSSEAMGSTGDQPFVVGRLGSTQQGHISEAGAGIADVKGDYVVLQGNQDAGSPIELWSVDSPHLLLGIDTPVAGATVDAVWLDLSHRQLFYLSAGPSGEEVRRVGLDGTGDRSLSQVNQGDGLTSLGGLLALDESLFGVEACSADKTCKWWHVDPDTLEVAQLSVSAVDDLDCYAGGIMDGWLVRDCFDTTAVAGHRVALSRIDGSQQNTLGDGEEYTRLVATGSGTVVVYTRPTAGGGKDYRTIDLETGFDHPLFGIDGNDPAINLRPANVLLPPEWFLLARDLASLAGTSDAIVPVPRVVNVVTGEVIELTNLPHNP